MEGGRGDIIRISTTLEGATAAVSSRPVGHPAATADESFSIIFPFILPRKQNRLFLASFEYFLEGGRGAPSIFLSKEKHKKLRPATEEGAPKQEISTIPPQLQSVKAIEKTHWRSPWNQQTSS